MSNWNDEREAQLTKAVGKERPVTQETVARVAEELEVSPRSVSAKLRKMEQEVEKVGNRAKTFSPEEEDALRAFLEDNQDEYTYGDVAAGFAGGKFSAKQIQGKVLSMEMTDFVKATPKPESTKTYSDAEEATFIKLANAGKFLEEIADSLKRPLASVRGKALSLLRAEAIASIPKQKESHANKVVDPLDALGDISELTVAEIAKAIDKTERGVKVMITHRQLKCADYTAKTKKAK
jgi:DNA-binding transcriptional ArsR family regulator